MKFLHAMIRVKDLNKSLDFYEKLLGLVPTRTIELEDSKLHYLTDGTIEIELTENFEIPENGYDNGAAFGHFAFECENLDEFSKKVKETGYEYLWEPFYLKEIDTRIAFLKDPDGNEIEIIESRQ